MQAELMDEDTLSAGKLPELATLEQEMLKAQEGQDHVRLVLLYRQAAEIRFSQGDVDAACFYLTHAYVFALETGHVMQGEIRALLAAHGREPAD